MFTSAGKAAASSEAVYIESVFSTYLYTGTGATQTITNNIDLSTYGGLVWIKDRAGTYSGQAHQLTDTVRGYNSQLSSNSTGSASSNTNYVSSFSSTGFVLGNSSSVNGTSTTWASWTFRKQAKFFDVVTFTKNASTNQRISHNLGATPGCIMVKSTDAVGNWTVWHRSLASATDSYMILNSTGAATASANAWGSTGPTSTDFGVSSVQFTNGINYVAYLFAHDAGGFGPAGSDNVISCGSFTCDGSGNFSVNLGYEPQWILLKATNAVEDWFTTDNMRGWNAGGWTYLIPSSSAAEASATNLKLNATGFTGSSSASRTYIYIAIRRGPMKTPTSGTSVFNLRAGADGTGTGNVADTTEESKIMKVDLAVFARRGGSVNNFQFADKLRGFQNADNPPVDSLTTPTLKTSNADSEATSGNALYVSSENNSTVRWRSDATGGAKIAYAFRRAPGFFDEVCYTGTGSATTFNHNLTVVPELMIVKSRNNATNWAVYCAYLGGANPANRYVWLNSSNGFGGTAVYWNDTAPTSTVFTVGTTASTNTSSYTYVNYLFATVAGVSKVGSYTGTGALQTINCGFAAGARFVLIKRTDSTGDWYVYDSARGITSGNDPYLFLNSTAAEVTGTNYVDTASTGFQVTAAAPAGLNANGGTYIFLAIA